MSEDGRGQEYLDENFCTHDNVYIDNFEVINSSEDVLITIRCQNCGETQDHTLCIENMIHDLNLGWEE